MNTLAHERAPGRPWRSVLAVALLAAALSATGLADGLERRAVDALETRAGRAPARSRIVIVGITAQCLERLGRWPLPRATHGKLIERLVRAGARGVLFDVITEHPSPRGPADDAALERAVKAAGNVVVPITLASNQEAKTGLPALRAAAFAVGHVHFRPDEDEVLRAFEARLVVDRQSYPALPIAAVALARGEKLAEVAPGRREIEFTAAPGEAFAMVTYADVLEGRVPDDALAGRLACVGSVEEQTLLDRHVTPVGAMNGVEVLATATATLLSPLPRAVLGGWTVAGLLALIALAAGALVGRPEVVPWRGVTRAFRGVTGSRGATGGRTAAGSKGAVSVSNPASRPSVPARAPDHPTVGPVTPVSRTGRATGGATQRPRRMMLAPPPSPRVIAMRGGAFVALVGASVAAAALVGRHTPLVMPVATAAASYFVGLVASALARRNALGAGAEAAEFGGRREPLVTLARRALGKDYEDLELIGTGGSGFVVRAHWLAQDLPVAVKFLSPQLATLPEARDRFRRESTLLASLRHPALLTVYAMSDAALPHFTMELMEGGHLGGLLEGDGDRLPAEDTGRLLAPIADALAYLHEHGVAHRDVKPANILLDQQGASRLTDFSVAGSRELPALTRPGQQLGTPVFMAPEALRGDVTDDGRPADVYALAVVIYLCLTGRLPFAENMHPAARLLVEPTPIEAPGLDPRLAQIVMRGLAREPSARPPATELVAALRAVAGEERRA